VKIHTSFESLEGVKNPVVTIGTFDGVHRGHQTILSRLQEIARTVDGESVLLSFFPHPRMVLHPEDHRVELLSSPDEKALLLSAAGIDHLMIYPFSHEFSRMSAFDYVRDILVTGLNTHTVVVGYDHRFGRNREGNHDTLIEMGEIFGFRVEEIPAKVIDQNNVSSTKIRQALQSGRITEANEYLGYNYSISGKVSHGDKIGRTLGFPTANILTDYPHKLIPSNGIYAVKVHAGGNSFNGVLNIGVRPTVNSNNRRSVEVYILNFEKEIYDEKISVELLSYLREEKKFGSIDELKQEIQNDIVKAKNWFLD
jgi:riboflavin kinase/FMN adenylyltransferase